MSLSNNMLILVSLSRLDICKTFRGIFCTMEREATHANALWVVLYGCWLCGEELLRPGHWGMDYLLGHWSIQWSFEATCQSFAKAAVSEDKPKDTILFKFNSTRCDDIHVWLQARGVSWLDLHMHISHLSAWYWGTHASLFNCELY